MADDPIREEHRVAMNDIAKQIDRALRDNGLKGKVGFALLVFDFGGGGFMNYISNADRDDMLRAMGEFIARNGGAEKAGH